MRQTTIPSGLVGGCNPSSMTIPCDISIAGITTECTKSFRLCTHIYAVSYYHGVIQLQSLLQHREPILSESDYGEDAVIETLQCFLVATGERIASQVTLHLQVVWVF